MAPESFWAAITPWEVSVVRAATMRKAPSLVIARITESFSGMFPFEAHWRSVGKRYS
jgi:hypothetical protein